LQLLRQELPAVGVESRRIRDAVLAWRPQGIGSEVAYAAAYNNKPEGLPLHPLTIDRVLAYGGVKIHVASDTLQRRFIGIGLGLGERGNLVFIEVLPATIGELENGSIDLHTAIRERGIGLIFETPRHAVRRADTPAEACAPT
jgi:hypothetical protein